MNNLLFTISNNFTTIAVAVIAFLGIATPAILSFLTFKRQGRMAIKQDEIHKQINGKMGELIEVTKQAATLKGAADNQAATDAKPQDKK